MAVVGHAQEQRRAFAGDDDAVRVLLVDDGNDVGAHEALGGQADGLVEVQGGLLLGGLDEVGDGFGVGFRGEVVALALEIGPEGFVVFDDAVVEDGDAARDVGAGVFFTGGAVGGPAGVGNAGPGVMVLALSGQIGHPPHGAQALQALGLVDGEAVGVVPPVFEFVQAFDQDRNDVVLSNGRDDSAHGG